MRFLSSGFSHGKALMGIVDGFPANVPIDADSINYDLARRQSGYGRGGRQKIEKDRVDFISGVKDGKTTGSPIGYLIWNKDYKIEELPSVYCPRPGHADLPGAIKFAQEDIRNILERASARETAVRVVAGSLANQLLSQLGVRSLAFVRQIGEIKLEEEDIDDWSFEFLNRIIPLSEVFCPSPEKSEEMKKQIDKAQKHSDTLGGVVEVWIEGLPPGIGTFTQWDQRLDGKLAQAVMSIPAIKGVEIGEGIWASSQFGSKVHDAIYYDEDKGYYRKTNRAGGIEGGMTNGERVVVRAYMKPIATLGSPLDSVDIRTKEATKATVERFDTCAVPAASVVVESMCRWVVAEMIVEKFGGDTLEDIKKAFDDYKNGRAKQWSER